MARLITQYVLLALPLVLGTAAAQGEPVAAADPPDQDPVAVRTDYFTIPLSAVLLKLEDSFAAGVLDELILEALAEQKAEAMGVALPTRAAVLSEYDKFIRGLASARGVADVTADLGKLVEDARLVAYFQEAGITQESVVRRLRLTLIAEACLATEVKVTDEELDASMGEIRPLVVSRAQRRVGLSVFDTREEAEEHLHALQEPGSKVLTQKQLLAVKPQPGTSDALADAIFAMEKVGDYAGPVEYRGRFYVIELESIALAGDEVPDADKLTPEELALRKLEIEQSIRDRARELLLRRKIAEAVPGWLAKLREEGDVELLWQPGPEASSPRG